MSAKVISFVNFKGGVGKTALAVNLATSLASQFGEKVLLVDLDPQSNASTEILGPERWQNEAFDKPHKTAYGLLMNQNPIDFCTIKGAITNENNMILVPTLDLIPSCYQLIDIEHTSIGTGQDHPYITFWKQIAGSLRIYNYIIIDCPPNIYKTTQCAIFSSHSIFIPCNPDALSIIGLSLLAKEIDKFKKNTQHNHFQYRQGHKQPEISGIIINNQPITQTVANRTADANLRRKLGDLKSNGLVAPEADVYPIPIRHAADFRTASFEYKPLLFAKIRNKDLLSDYRNLANLIRQRLRGE